MLLLYAACGMPMCFPIDRTSQSIYFVRESVKTGKSNDMNRMLSDLDENAKAIRSCLDERTTMLENFLKACRYPDKSEVTIKRITTVFDKPVAPEIVLKMYRRNVDEKKKEHEDFISAAQCRG